MTGQTKTRRQKIADFLLGKKEKKSPPEDYIELPLAGSAIRATADQKLKQRFYEWETALQIIKDTPMPENPTLYEYCTHLLDVFESLKLIVQRVVYAYMRAGDKEEKEAKHLMHGWTKLYGIFRSMLLENRLFWGTDEAYTDARHQYQSIEAIQIQNFSMGCDNIFFPYTDLLISQSFRDMDVRPTSVTVVVTAGETKQTGVQTQTDPTGLRMMQQKIQELEEEINRYRNK